jgi:hypothetical protein
MTASAAGRAALSLWAGVNLALALAILVRLLALHGHAPALDILFDRADLAQLDPRALATIDGLAVFANGIAAAFCALVLALVWLPLRRGERWALVAVAAATGFVQLIGFACDAFFGHKNLAANTVSAVVLASGLALCARGRRAV